MENYIKTAGYMLLKIVYSKGQFLKIQINLYKMPTRTFRDGIYKSHQAEYEESDNTLSIKFSEFPGWEILREKNFDGTYDIIAISHDWVHGYSAPPTGYCAYEGLNDHQWRTLIRTFLKGSFKNKLEEELGKVKKALGYMIDSIDGVEFP